MLQDFKIVSDEAGFEMHLLVDEEQVSKDGWLVVNCHALAPDILAEVKRTIGFWWADGLDMAREYASTPEAAEKASEGAYDPSDPKSPGWADRMAGFYDNQDKTGGRCV